jgi:catalase
MSEIPAAKLTSDILATFTNMSSNSNQHDLSQHPLEATATAIASAAKGENKGTRAFHMMSANEGPMDIISKVSGVTQGGKREDDGPYYTNNEGIPFPDP